MPNNPGAVRDPSGPVNPLPRMELLKVGSDPEALFHDANGLVPANQVVGTSRALSSWIGTDGHSSTAELRPRPSKDVWLHVRDIAEALTIIDREVCQKEPGFFMVAQPHESQSNLTCGGHIHFSFLLHDPISVPVIMHGTVWNVAGSGEREVPRGNNVHPTRIAQTQAYSAYLPSARTGQAFSFHTMVAKLHAAIVPLETNLYSVARRARRGYGNGEDALRSEHPAIPVAPGVVRWRLEYRYPSTWLAHPALALTYFGLTKLVVNNYAAAPALATDESSRSLAGLAGWLSTFMQRNDVKVTEDIRHLPKLLRYVETEIRPRLQEPLVKVDFNAWTTFFNEGRWK